jgi:hypothetical protein
MRESMPANPRPAQEFFSPAGGPKALAPDEFFLEKATALAQNTGA